MRRSSMVVLAVGVAVALCHAPVRAQDTRAVSQGQLHYQLGQFERNLGAAARHAAEVVANKAAAAMPGVMLFINQEPEVHGWPIEEYGLLFNVQIPGILQTAAMLLKSSPPPGPARTGNIGAQTTPVAADPMKVSPTVPGIIADPDDEYTQAVREALIDAMLDYSGSLIIGDNEWLMVAASDGAGSMSNALADQRTTMFLRIKGSDLSKFRAKTLSREDARTKVEVKHK